MSSFYEIQKTSKRTRGCSAPSQQLSKLQRQILTWIFEATHDIDIYKTYRDQAMFPGHNSDSINKYIANLNQRGAAWSAKRFYADAPTKSQIVALSKALHRLESRGLVILFDASEGLGRKPRTTHVRLTKVGTEAARALKKSNGLSQRELIEQCPQRISQRNLWALRRQWIQSQADYEYAMAIFVQVATHLAAIDETRAATKVPHADGQDEGHFAYIEELEFDIRTLEERSGLPAKELRVPQEWKTDGGYYREDLAQLEHLREQFYEIEIPF